MAEKPIPFSTPMVQAILDGRKTMTRRVIKPQPEPGKSIKQCGYCESGWSTWEGNGCNCTNVPCPYGAPGDRLYVRETWCKNGEVYLYKAGCPHLQGNVWIKWKPSIHMPKAAARIWLEVVSVRVERLQEIATDDAKAEGVLQPGVIPSNTLIRNTEGSIPRTNFKILWDSLNASRGFSWEQNPWVWVIEFRRVA